MSAFTLVSSVTSQDVTKARGKAGNSEKNITEDNSPDKQLMSINNEKTNFITFRTFQTKSPIHLTIEISKKPINEDKIFGIRN